MVPADREVKRIKANVPFQSTGDGWFLPDTLWIEVREALEDCKLRQPLKP